LHKYEGILIEHAAPGLAEVVLETFVESPDIIYQRIFYNWNVITSDPDDNKFFDAAVAGDADYLVTNDGHFKDSLKIDFPKINIISADDFLRILSTSG
jgi:predicted nucleic acid-binding protein